MVQYLFTSGRSTIAGNTYAPLVNVDMHTNASHEDEVQCLTPAGQTASFTMNSAGGTTTSYVRINGVAGNEIISNPSGLTGQLTDTTHSDTIPANAALDVYTVITGAGGFGFYNFSVIFSSTSTVLANNVNSGETVSGASTTYAPFFGTFGTLLSATEANTQYTMRVPGRCTGLAAYITSNSNTNNATVKFRKNGVTQTQTVTIGAGLTGWFQDTTNTDTFGAGDTINSIVSAGNNSMSMWTVQTYMGGGSAVLANANMGGGSTFTSGTQYTPLTGGSISGGTIEANSQVLMNFTLKFQYLLAKITSNSVNGNTVITLRKNGAGSALTVTIPSGTTGVFEDTTHTVPFVASDLFDMQLAVGGSSGTIVFAFVGVTIPQATATVIGPIEVFPQVAL